MRALRIYQPEEIGIQQQRLPREVTEPVAQPALPASPLDAKASNTPADGYVPASSSNSGNSYQIPPESSADSVIFIDAPADSGGW